MFFHAYTARNDSIQTMNEENDSSSRFLFAPESLSVSQVIKCLKIGTHLSNKGIFTYFFWMSIFVVVRLDTHLKLPGLTPEANRSSSWHA